MIQVEQLSKSYGDRLLFQDVSFSIAEGEKCGLIAANGTGKTTLLRIITGEETPDSGTITTRKDLRIAYLPQRPHPRQQITEHRVHVLRMLNGAGGVCEPA